MSQLISGSEHLHPLIIINNPIGKRHLKGFPGRSNSKIENTKLFDKNMVALKQA